MHYEEQGERECVMNQETTMGDRLKDNLKRFTLLMAFLVIVVMFQILTKGILLVPQNVTNLIQQNSYILILAIGMLMCIITGGNIDLGVGSYVAFVGAIAAKLTIVDSNSSMVAIVITLLIGIAIGMLNGYFIAYRGIPAFITTLASMLLFRGLTLVVLAGRTLAPFKPDYQIVSTGFLPALAIWGGVKLSAIVIGALVCPFVIWVFIRKRSELKQFGSEVIPSGLFAIQLAGACAAILLLCFWLGRYEGIPSVLILLVVIYLIYYLITTRTVVGRHLYALGGNERAARLSGIKTKRLKFLAFVNMGFLASIAGIVFSGRLNAATPKAGSGFELDAIAACYIGGASASGGIGTVGGAVIGGLIMGVLNNGMSIMGINVDWQQAIKGVVLLIAVLFDISSKSKQK